MHIAHTETKYPGTPYALTIKIVLDETGTESPADNDEAIIFAVLHRNYINPAQERGLVSAAAIADFAVENASEWKEFPLYLYDHGNTLYKVGEDGNPFHCQWDSGRVGSCFVKVADVGDDPRKAADSFCEVYTAWANGQIFGYIVEDADGNELDSCWCFIEPDGPKGYVLEAAREAAEYQAEKMRQDNIRADNETKAWAQEFGIAI